VARKPLKNQMAFELGIDSKGIKSSTDFLFSHKFDPATIPITEAALKSVTRGIVQASSEYYKKINLKTIVSVYDFVHEVIPKIKNYKLVAIDTETTGLDYDDWIIGVSLAFGDASAYYIPIKHVTSEKQFQEKVLWDELSDLFLDPEIKWVLHNAKFDCKKFYTACKYFPLNVEDTACQHFLLDENGSHKLKVLADTFLFKGAANEEGILEAYMEAARKIFPEAKKRYVSYAIIPISLMAPYACKDAVYTFDLYQLFKAELQAKGFAALYEQERRTLLCLLDQEIQGFRVDKDAIKKIQDTYVEIERVASKKIYDFFGFKFDVASTKQLISAFKSKGIDTGKISKKSGEMKTDELSLCFIKKRYPIVKDILDVREANKVVGTYCNGILDRVTKDGKLHTSYNQIVAVTSRLSSSNPNMQNWPRGAPIKRALVPESDQFIYVCCDLSQIELRLAAIYSKDPKMIYAYKHGIDLHAQTGCGLFGVTAEELTKEQRTVGKQLNFSAFYGCGAKKFQGILLKEANIFKSVKDCAEYINIYWKTYDVAAAFVSAVRNFATRNGYVKEMFGHVRRLPALKTTTDEFEMEEMLRQAVNFMIQGSAAHIFKTIMTNCYEFLLEEGARTRLVGNIHDEIIFEWHREEQHLVEPILAIFSNWNFEIPILADLKIAPRNLYDKISYKNQDFLTM